MRQMMHGAIDFNSLRHHRLPALVPDLARRRRRTAQGSTRHSRRLGAERAGRKGS